MIGAYAGLMLGPLIIAFVIIVAIPVGFLMSTPIAAAIIGFLLKDDAERRHSGSVLVETNE